MALITAPWISIIIIKFLNVTFKSNTVEYRSNLYITQFEIVFHLSPLQRRFRRLPFQRFQTLEFFLYNLVRVRRGELIGNGQDVLA